MLAYMKMAKSDDAGPWFAPPSRLHSEIQDSKSQFFCENSMETPETSLEMNSEPEQHSNMDEDSPLCLVVKKNKDGHYSSLVSEDKGFLPTPPGSPAESHFSTSHPRLSSPLRVDVHQQGLSVSPVSSTHFQDQNSHQNLLNSLPLISPADFMESPIFARALASGAPKRPRGEKKPIPDEQKDGKYYERRKRNNLAAKKSRDARKSREDQIALRATTLEKENAVLRAQLVTLREEADSLRLLLIQKRSR